jgi:hypothetical protein
MTRRFQAARDLNFKASGREIHVERGERFFLNFRYRFAREAFRWLVTKHARLKIMGEIPRRGRPLRHSNLHEVKYKWRNGRAVECAGLENR